MKTRYPGAQPFSDDVMSRKLFFGRDRVARLLTDQILAKRLIVLYAKSGLGKTSLLNAAVAPQLRDEGHLPLTVRVNDVDQGPYQSVLHGIRAEAARQQVEYVPGNTDTLWNFFNTSEFWRGDLLLVPVLILDQFEEIFTLQSEQQREQFLAELSHLVRGVPPPSSTRDFPSTDWPAADLSESAPLMHIVLSLREDYLGFLEEAADQIPQILDARFRLAPLDLQAAEDAITKPASVDNPALNTLPFAFEQDAVKLILDFLSKRRMKSPVQSAPHVEPFQLQLICRQLEQLVESRQHNFRSPLIITMKDIGGEAAITKTLKHFYIDTIGSLPRRRERQAAKRLCEEYLISPEGRRLSLEENEIYLQLKLHKISLRTLVESRLLRGENRSESVYYELSHDSLVMPILESKRIKSLFTGWIGFSAGMVFFSFSVLFILIIPFVAFQYSKSSATGSEAFGEALGLILAVISVLGVFIFSAILVRSSARSLTRYRGAGAAAESRQEPMASSLSGWVGVIVGSIVLPVALLVGYELVALTSLSPEAIPPISDTSGDYQNQIREHGIGLDLFAYAVAISGLIVFSFRCIGWGITRFARYRISHRRRFDEKLRSRGKALLVLAATLKNLLAALFITSCLLIIILNVVMVDCKYIHSQHIPNWISPDWFTMLATDCLSTDSYLFDFAVNILLVFVLVWLARQMLRQVVAIAKDIGAKIAVEGCRGVGPIG